MNREAIALPSLKKDSKLPVILNRQELKELFAAPTLLKQRIVLTLIYSAGLRGQEVINLKISDIDFERKTIHIRPLRFVKIRHYGIYNHMVKRNQKTSTYTFSAGSHLQTDSSPNLIVIPKCA